MRRFVGANGRLKRKEHKHGAWRDPAPYERMPDPDPTPWYEPYEGPGLGVLARDDWSARTHWADGLGAVETRLHGQVERVWLAYFGWVTR